MVLHLVADSVFIFLGFTLNEIYYYNQIFEINENSLQMTCQLFDVAEKCCDNFKKEKMFFKFLISLINLQSDFKTLALIGIVIYLDLRMFIVKFLFNVASKFDRFEFMWKFRLLIFGPSFSILIYLSMNLILNYISMTYAELLNFCAKNGLL